MEIPTLLRRAEHRALATITLSGSVLDLGGEKRSEYRDFFIGSPTYTLVNLAENEGAKADITHDLEQLLPLSDGTYDHVLLINVLEHIYAYRQLLTETARVLTPGGSVVIVVPFLFPVHPSPHDFRRFTKEALIRELTDAGLEEVRVTALGTGVFATQFVLFDRLLPGPLRFLHYYLCSPFVELADALFTATARLFGKKYDPADYALGYVVEGKKAV